MIKLDEAAEQRLLTTYVVTELVRQDRDLQRMLLDRMPGNSKRQAQRVERWAIRHATDDPDLREGLSDRAEWLRENMASGRTVVAWREAGRVACAEGLLWSRWAVLQSGTPDLWKRFIAHFTADELSAYERKRDAALRGAREREQTERAHAQQSQQRELHAERARLEAVRQMKKADQARSTASLEVAAARREQRRLAQELQRAQEREQQLREQIDQRDADLAWVIEHYEGLLRAPKGEPAPSLPLAGSKLAVVAHPNRQVLYRKAAEAMGVREVRFIDGTRHPGPELRGLLAWADIVVVSTRWITHPVGNTAKALARDRYVEIDVTGVEAFREALLRGCRAA